jgi:hypothetical protein
VNETALFEDPVAVETIALRDTGLLVGTPDSSVDRSARNAQVTSAGIVRLVLRRVAAAAHDN